MLQLFIEYYETTGYVPSRSSCYKGKPIGSWAMTQRTKYGAGQLSMVRFETLNALACWSWSMHNDDWLTMFKHLRRREPHHQKLMSCSGALYNWIMRQRRKYRAGELPQDQIEMLESIPKWGWEGPVNV